MVFKIYLEYLLWARHSNKCCTWIIFLIVDATQGYSHSVLQVGKLRLERPCKPTVVTQVWGEGRGEGPDWSRIQIKNLCLWSPSSQPLACSAHLLSRWRPPKGQSNARHTDNNPTVCLVQQWPSEDLARSREQMNCIIFSPNHHHVSTRRSSRCHDSEAAKPFTHEGSPHDVLSSQAFYKHQCGWSEHSCDWDSHMALVG